MPHQPLFAGLIVDENDQPVSTTYIGGEPFYVVNDAGFLRHIPSEQVDRQVLQRMKDMVEGNEGLISEQAAKMLGQDDIFTRAMIENQLKHIDRQFDMLFDVGIPEDMRVYLGMSGFKVVVDYHGYVKEVRSGAAPEDGGEGGGDF